MNNMWSCEVWSYGGVVSGDVVVWVYGHVEIWSCGGVVSEYINLPVNSKVKLVVFMALQLRKKK